MSLLLNMLSRLVITFLPRSKRLLISWLQSPFAVILELPKIKSDTVFRKMVMMTLYARQQKRFRCIGAFWTLWERARLGFYGKMALKHVSYISRVTIYSLEVHLFLFGTSLLFHVQ